MIPLVALTTAWCLLLMVVFEWGVALHDPLALLFAEDESLCTYEECFIGVETRDGISLGKTVTDCYSDVQLENNGYLVQTVDRARFAARIKELLGAYTS